MKKLFLFLVAIFICTSVRAQNQVEEVVDSVTANSIIERCATRYPKFYREFQYVKTHDKLIRRFIFIRTVGLGNGPAFAGPKGGIKINVKFLETEVPTFDDNRLIVVLYHEIGHLHYFFNTPIPDRTSEDSEKAAFDYSLSKTKDIAEQGDCLPLKAGIKFMKIRSESNNLEDPHVRALKRIVNEPAYAGYVQYVKKKCSN